MPGGVVSYTCCHMYVIMQHIDLLQVMSTRAACCIDHGLTCNADAAQRTQHLTGNSSFVHLRVPIQNRVIALQFSTRRWLVVGRPVSVAARRVDAVYIYLLYLLSKASGKRAMDCCM